MTGLLNLGNKQKIWASRMETSGPAWRWARPLEPEVENGGEWGVGGGGGLCPQGQLHTADEGQSQIVQDLGGTMQGSDRCP